MSNRKRTEAERAARRAERNLGQARQDVAAVSAVLTGTAVAAIWLRDDLARLGALLRPYCASTSSVEEALAAMPPGEAAETRVLLERTAAAGGPDARIRQTTDSTMGGNDG